MFLAIHKKLLTHHLQPIPYVNKVIKAINKIIDAINRIIDTLMPVARAIFQIIIVVTVVYAVTKIITKIPSFGAGMGAVVVFDMFKSVAFFEFVLHDSSPTAISFLVK